MEELVALLKRYGLTIGTCESLTAGLFASEIAGIPGASAVLKGGIITYQTLCKEQVVNVPHALIQKYGVISAPCVEAMAYGAKKLLQCDICVSFSGNAGPDIMDDKPVGLVYCGIAICDECLSFECYFQGTRNEIRLQCVSFMCDKILEILKEREETMWKKK